jgi:pimeloyl-ACP methyl ester carboxylesterase
MHWLLLRGLAREQRHWGDFPLVFARALPHTTAHCLDLPGAGTEHRRRSPDTIATIADDVRTRWLALRHAHPGPWGLFGMSLGGMIAMDWCASHPADFARVVLASTSAGDLSRPWRRFGLAILPRAVRVLAGRDAVRRERGILTMTTELVANADAIAADWACYPDDRPMARTNVLRQLRAASVFRAPPRLDVPTLVMAGAGDRMTDPSCSRRLAARFGAPLVVHPAAGHELCLDAPTWVTGEIASWLGQVSSRATSESA